MVRVLHRKTHGFEVTPSRPTSAVLKVTSVNRGEWLRSIRPKRAAAHPNSVDPAAQSEIHVTSDQKASAAAGVRFSARLGVSLNLTHPAQLRSDA